MISTKLGRVIMNKMVKTVLTMMGGFSAGTLAGVVAVGKSLGKEADRNKELADKHLALFLLMNQWVKVKQEGKNLASYFEKKGYKRIAIYGMSYAGETLISELKDTDIEVVYGIDKNADSIYTDIEVVSVDDTLEEVDAIVVTAITFFDEIEEMLNERIGCPIISLDDLVYDI